MIEMEYYKRMWLFTFIQDRIEKGQTESFPASMFTQWGYTESEALEHLMFLVDDGLLTKTLMVYDHEDDCFEEYNGKDDLSCIPASQMKWLFKPTVLAIHNTLKREE